MGLRTIYGKKGPTYSFDKRETYYDSSRILGFLEQTEENKNNCGSICIRVNTWSELIKKGKENLIIGNGLNIDRVYLKKTNLKNNNSNLGNESANGFIFIFFSSGIIGLTIFIYFLYKQFILLNKTFFYLKKNNQNYIVLSSFLITIFLLIRLISESGFTSYGVDFILFFSNYVILKKTIAN